MSAPRRWYRTSTFWIFAGVVLGILFGGFLIVYTDLSLKVFIVLVAIWLIVAGLLALVAAFKLRSLRPAA